ncbi:hypothetical protein OAG36_01180 [bacterium]|nr:hypothetical protein [bacterium]
MLNEFTPAEKVCARNFKGMPGRVQQWNFRMVRQAMMYKIQDKAREANLDSVLESPKRGKKKEIPKEVFADPTRKRVSFFLYDENGVRHLMDNGGRGYIFSTDSALRRQVEKLIAKHPGWSVPPGPQKPLLDKITVLETD